MAAYFRLPLYLKILVGAILGAPVGWALGSRADALGPVADLVLRALTLLATPLIFFGLFHAILTAPARGRTAGRLLWVMLTNSLAATGLGLLVADVVRPGGYPHFLPSGGLPESGPPPVSGPFAGLFDRFPRDFVSPFAGNDILAVVILAVALAVALRGLRNTSPAHDDDPAPERAARIDNLAGYAKLGLDAVVRMLHWVFELIPLATFAIVARVVGTSGFAPFRSMLAFVLAVVVALVLTAGFYALRLRLAARMGSREFVAGARDALLLAFSTASSAATLPVTYECAVDQFRVREEVASLGVMAGGTFNHDGGALYQAVSAAFVAQLVGRPLGFGAQVALVLISVVASVCTAGIPQAGLVSMVAVLHALGLPIEYIPFLLPVDWLLDRCRTAINVAGNLAATCIVDRAPPP